MPKKMCLVEACPSKSANGGKCWKHYNEDYRAKYGFSRKRKYKRGEKGKLAQKNYQDKARYETLGHYSKNVFECNCCQETIYQFLTLDHIFNNGAQHRREINNRNIYIWCRKIIIQKGFKFCV